MRIGDHACMASGTAYPSLVDVRTGRRTPFGARHNMLSFMSAEAMAAAFGGDPSYIPAKVGFIYGDKSTIPIGEEITRNQDWGLLKSTLKASDPSANVDVQVVGFSYSPTLGGERPSPAPSPSPGGTDPGADSGTDSGTDSGDGGSVGSGGDYSSLLPGGSNAITFHAVSNSQDGGAFGRPAFTSGKYVYQAVLLGSHGGRNYIISRVSLKEGGAYRAKPSGFELALDWTIAFR